MYILHTLITLTLLRTLNRYRSIPSVRVYVYNVHVSYEYLNTSYIRLNKYTVHLRNMFRLRIEVSIFAYGLRVEFFRYRPNGY